MKTDAVYARQSVEKKDSLSIAGQIDLCHRTADGGELRVYSVKSGLFPYQPEYLLSLSAES